MKNELATGSEERMPQHTPPDRQEADPPPKASSVFDLLKGKLIFTDERPWVKIVITVLTMLFLWAIIHELKVIGVVGFVIRKLSDLKWNRLVGGFRGGG